MKKLLTLLITILLLFSLASCQLADNGETPDNGTGEGGKPDSPDSGEGEKEPLHWGESEKIYFLGDGEVNTEDFRRKFTLETGAELYIGSIPEGGRTFSVGESNTTLASRAYTKLDRGFSGEENIAAYAIVKDEGSVAIAYSSLVARYAALDYFLSEYDNLDLSGSGTLALTEFAVLPYVSDESAALRAESIEALQGQLSEGAVSELKRLYSFYSTETYLWLANLYCPEVGGFYYSASGRDTKGFLPDLESTAQALIFMADSGMLAEYGNKYRYALPEEMREAIIAFTRGTQDSSDGYFYHTQWGKDVGKNRIDRDLGWATRILSGLGSSPLYDTENGFKGELGAPGASAALALPLGVGRVTAVSAVIPTAKPEYLVDLALFKKHLEEDFDFENASYKSGNALESELGQIQNAGPRFTELLITFLNEKQKPNGLWEDKVSYDSVNGLMKISVVYESLSKPIPNADRAMESAIQMLRSTEEPAHVCSVYNPWVAVSNTVSSIQRTSGKTAADELRQMFRDEAESLLAVTVEKLSLFKKDDGGFSYYKKYSAPNSQGVPVALDKSAESDVNATNICINSINNAIFEVFGVEQAERFFPVDLAYFLDTLGSLGFIVKDELLPAEPITFDVYDPDYGKEEGGVVTYPDDLAEMIIGDGETVGEGEYRWIESEIVRNPLSGTPSDDLVLRVRSKVDVGAAKALADKPSSTRFYIPNASFDSLGDCYVFDADMYFTPGYGKTGSSGKATSDPIIQIFFMTESLPCASLNFSVYTDGGVDYVKIGENYAGIDGKESNIAGEIPMGEWVNIRLEYYKLYEEIDGKEVYKPMMKIFVNGRFKGDCDATITGADSKGSIGYYDRKIDQVSISYYRFVPCEVYFNNVLAERTRRDYVTEIDPDAIVDPPLPEEDMRESYGFEEAYLNTSNVRNLVRISDFGVYKYINASEGQTYNPSISYSIVPDPTDAANRVLKVAASRSSELDKPSRTEVMLYNSSAVGNEYVFSGRFYYDTSAIGVNGDLTQIFFLNGQDKQLYALRITAKKTDGRFTLSLVESNNATGDTGSGRVLADELPTDAWFTLRVALCKADPVEGSGAEIFIDEREVIVDPSYKSALATSSPVIKLALVHQRTNSSLVYLDDLSFKRSGEIREPVVADEKVASFTEGFNTKYVKSYSFSGSTLLEVDSIDAATMETLYTKYYLYDDPKDAANRVLRAVNKNGGTNAGYTEVSVSEGKAGSCYVFESRMFVETASLGYNFAELSFLSADGTQLLSTYISIDKSTSLLKIATTGNGSVPTKGTNLLDGSGVEVKAKEWFTLRMEFYHNGENATATDTYLKLYVNDTLAYSGIAYRSLGKAVETLRITHCKTTKSSAVYYDDVSLTRSEQEYQK